MTQQVSKGISLTLRALPSLSWSALVVMFAVSSL